MIELFQSMMGTLSTLAEFIFNSGKALFLGLNFLTSGLGSMLTAFTFMPTLFGSVMVVSLVIGILLLIMP